MECSKSKKAIYNQKYSDANPERMKRNSSINYGINRESILLKRAHDRYIKGSILRESTLNRLIDAGFDVILTKPKYQLVKEV
jgi:fructose-bisphosphate aldolase class 1